MKYLINMVIAFFLYPLTRLKYKNKKIFLVGGNAGELFVDNAKAMYEYLNSIKDKENIEVYWVINKNSSSYDKVTGDKLTRGSIKCYLYFMNSKVSLFSHSISADIVPYLFVVPFINKFHYQNTKVFLNHGTVGLKKRVSMKDSRKEIVEKLLQSYDINISDSDFEKNIKHIDWKIDEDNIYVTGYPRYDYLIDKSNKNKIKKILFMPTWRNWIKLNDEKIEDTEYFKTIIELITNNELLEFLKEKNIEFNIYIHQLMHDYLQNFKNILYSESVKILPKSTDVADELMKSNILITDYSSVAYDFYYMDKPIIFFQFDKEKYKEEVGSYINLDTELFGDTAFGIEECIEKIKSMINNNYNYTKDIEIKNEELKLKYFKYIDRFNCDRIYDIIRSNI